MSYQGITSDDLFATLRVTGSSVEGPSSAVLVGGKGLGGFGFGDPDEGGETVTDAEAYGAPGVVFRPRPPENIENERIGAEAMSVRMSYGMVPLAWRDLRWNRVFPTPQPGTLAFVGYAGSLLAHEDVEADAENWTPPPGGGTAPKVKNARLTIYAPYGKEADGAPTKAHTIQLDPNGSLQIVQGDGYAVTLDPDNGIVLRDASGEAWISMKNGKIEIVGSSVTIRGNVALGADTTAALPLLPGPASQPTPSVFFSPT